MHATGGPCCELPDCCWRRSLSSSVWRPFDPSPSARAHNIQEGPDDRKLSVEMRDVQVFIAQRGSVVGKLTARLRNEGDVPIGVLKPHAGSFFGDAPGYVVHLTDPNGRAIAGWGGCVNLPWSAIREAWPHEYFVELAPGKTLEVEVPIITNVESPQPGKYRVDFAYNYEPNGGWLPPVPRARPGRVRAVPVVVEVGWPLKP